MRIGIDMDGVTYPFTQVFQGYAEYVLGEPLSVPTRWSFYEDWGLDTAEFLRLMEQGHDDGVLWREGAPLPGALDAVHNLYSWFGHEIVFCTHRPDYAQASTQRWLERWGFPHNDLIFASDKSQFGFDLLLDDSPGVWAECTGAGLRVVVFDRPWNDSLDCGNNRVGSWNEFVDFVSLLEAVQG